MRTTDIKIGGWYEAGIHGFVKVTDLSYGKPRERVVAKVLLPNGARTCVFTSTIRNRVTGPPAATLDGKLRAAKEAA